MASATLTSVITSPGDLKRTRRELDSLDDFLSQSSLRTGGKAVKLPPVSRLLENMAADNGLNLLKKTDRDRLRKFLTLLIQKAPVLHITLASEPSAMATGKLLTWLRANIHPQILVSIGVQPAIAAGCVVRTANREFDFSLRQSLDNQSALLIKNIRAIDAHEQAAAKPVAAESADTPTQAPAPGQAPAAVPTAKAAAPAAPAAASGKTAVKVTVKTEAKG